MPFLGNIRIKVGCPFATCITLENHNVIYLYTTSFRHRDHLADCLEFFRFVSLCCANFATLKKQGK